MGRPPKPKESHRKPVTVRLDPPVRAQLEAHAREASRSLATEIESRASALARLDDRGVDLVVAIANAIDLLEGTSKKRWHVDLRTWAAIAAMLADGPIHDFQPDLPEEDETIVNARDAVWKVRAQKSLLLTELEDLNVRCAGTDSVDALEEDDGTIIFGPIDRWEARKEAASIESDDHRSRATALIDELERLDHADVEASRFLHAQENLYREPKESGRRLYREVRQRLVDSYRRRNDPEVLMRAPLIWREKR